MKEKTSKLKYLKYLLKIKQNPSLDTIKEFVKSFYKINNMPTDFYEMLLNSLNSRKILKVIMTGNIYKLISTLKNNDEVTEAI